MHSRLMQFLFMLQSHTFVTFAKFAPKNSLLRHKIKTKQNSNQKFVIQIILELS